MGARFLELPLETAGAEDKSGYARALDEEFYRKQRELMARVVAESGLPIAGLTRSLLNPSHATSVGLLLWGLHEDARAVHRRFGAEHAGASAHRWMGAAAKWLKALLPDRD